MDNNKDPKEEFDQNNTDPSSTPTDSATTNDTESSENGSIETNTNNADQIPTNSQGSVNEPLGFGYYAQHIKEADHAPIKKTQWLFAKDADVPKNYNPYREDRSVFKEIFEENPDAFAGNAPLQDETIENYNIRIHREWLFARSKASDKLKKSSTLISLAVILYLVLSNSIGYALSFLTQLESISIDVLYNIITVFQYAFVFPAIIYIINLGKKHKTLTFFKKCEVSKFYIFKWSLISLGMTYLVAIIGNILFAIIESMGVYVNDLSTELPTDPTGLILYFLTVVICAPIFEEILFRGPILAQNLKHGAFFASVISGVIFGLIHQNHQQMFFAAVLGFIFCFIDIKAGSIIPSIIAHMVVNGYSFLNAVFLSFTNYNDTLQDPNIILEGPNFALAAVGILNSIVYLFIIIAIVLLIHDLITNNPHFFLSKGDNILTGGEKAKIFFSTPAAIIMLIMLVISITLNSFVNIEAIMNMIQG